MKNFYLAFLASIFSAFILSGCESSDNGAEEAGDKIEEAGEEVQDAAD